MKQIGCNAMTQQNPSLDDLMATFESVADQMDMPQAERAGILGVGEDELQGWSAEQHGPDRVAETRRRLEYALPLMRRSLSGG